MTFSKRLLSNSLPPGKNVRSNITKFPTPRNDLWSPAQTKIQISLPMGQQENSNALPPGQSDQFSICTNPIIHLFYPPQFCIIIVYNFSWDMKMSQGKSKTMPMQIVLGGRSSVIWYCASREYSNFLRHIKRGDMVASWLV